MLAFREITVDLTYFNHELQRKTTDIIRLNARNCSGSLISQAEEYQSPIALGFWYIYSYPEIVFNGNLLTQLLCGISQKW